MELNELMELVDVTAALQYERLELDRKSKELKKQEDAKKARIAQEMGYLGLTSLSGRSGQTATVKTSIEPMAADWGLIYDYIRQNDALDLLHKRLTASAIKLRWEEGQTIPGIDKYEETKLVIS